MDFESLTLSEEQLLSRNVNLFHLFVLNERECFYQLSKYEHVAYLSKCRFDDNGLDHEASIEIDSDGEEYTEDKEEVFFKILI